MEKRPEGWGLVSGERDHRESFRRRVHEMVDEMLDEGPLGQEVIVMGGVNGKIFVVRRRILSIRQNYGFGSPGEVELEIDLRLRPCDIH